MYFIYSLPMQLRFFFQNLLSFIINVKITGEDFIKDHKRGIIVCNHYDFSDLIIPLFYFPKVVYLIYPMDIQKNHIFDLLLNQNLNIFYDLLEIHFIKEEELENQIKQLSKDNLVFLFPELNPTHTGVIQPFNENIIKMIYNATIENDLLVFPSGINGTFRLSDFFSMIQLALQRVKINYNIGYPIQINNTVDVNDFKKELEKQTYALSLHPERRKKGRAIIRTDAREL
ncbi:MAG: hypothetical protein KatS3mg129_3304 [Leptospiraceae bacterium]|nr:MAG: hypothetical protein KatS3mg129_3304 [Leptospiraceae bacterium]